MPRATLTRRPLPARDETIEELTAAEREIATAVWSGRAEAELRAGGSFAYIADVLLLANAPDDLVALARRAIVDEQRHSQICWQVASAFAGRALPAPRRLPVTIPRHHRAAPELRRVLHVVGQCCLNETTGSAFLELCRAGATAPLASAALHELLSDEIDHARIGWAFVASPAVSDAARGELAAWLPELIAMNLAAWRARPRYAITPALVAHGCPSWDAVDAAVVAAIDDLIVPGFALVDAAVSRPDASSERGLPT
jgi:hypothetical protein